MGWGVVYYRAANGAVPAEAFLDSCPAKIEARILAVLEVVRAAPPPAFSGGGMWEAMHGSMNGYYEIRVTGPGRAQYRLFCLLDNAQTKKELARRGFDTPADRGHQWHVEADRRGLLRQRVPQACS